MNYSMLSHVKRQINNRIAQVVQERAEGDNSRYLGTGIVLFVREVLGVEPKPYQIEILVAFATTRRASARGPHGLGKSAVAAWCVLWLVSVFDCDVKVVTTASSWRQLERYLWPEIRKWTMRAKWYLVGLDVEVGRELLNLSLRIGEREAFAAASDNPATLEGAHATVIGYVFDEAKAIPDPTWDAAEGAFSQDGLGGRMAFALAISTPDGPSGRFYDIHARAPGFEDWWVRHVTLQEAIDAGQVSQQWVDQRRAQWGEDSEIFKRRALGEFAASGEDNVVPLDWVELANQRWLEFSDKLRDADEETLALLEGKPTCYGVDPARYGTDKSAFAKVRALFVEWVQLFGKLGTMELTGKVAATANFDDYIGVDVIGIGAGVVDRLAELGYNVEGVNVAEGSNLLDESGEIGFANLRSALWWMMRDLLNPAYNKNLMLPPDDQLTRELTIPHWRLLSRGVIQVESKDDIRKRLGRSTDSADAVILGVYMSVMGSSSGVWV